MSLSREVDFHCPHCKARNRATMWLRVDAVSDPSLAERAMDGSLFEHACWHCNQATVLDHTHLFQDPQRRVWLLNAPPGDPLAQELQELHGCESPPTDYRLRRVADLNAVKELLHIWRDGLDDAAMLLLKHLLAARVQQDRRGAPALCGYDARAQYEGREALEYIVFQTEESEPETLTVPIAVYTDLDKRVAPLKERLFPTGQWIGWDHTTARQVWEALQERGAM